MDNAARSARSRENGGGSPETFTGKTVFESLRDDLATPLQFEDFSYTFDTSFHQESVAQHPAYVIRLSARDLARVGLLMARNGRWAGGRSGTWSRDRSESQQRTR
jgi:CubicO group peptidase (beta-lactamase class C family)